MQIPGPHISCQSISPLLSILITNVLDIKGTPAIIHLAGHPVIMPVHPVIINPPSSVKFFDTQQI